MSIAELARSIGTKRSPAPLQEWESAQGPVSISTSTLEKLAKKTRAPYGMLFLSSPPDEQLPIRDFRRASVQDRRRPSLELIETIEDYQIRQSWYSEVLQEEGAEPIGFISSASTTDDPDSLAENMSSSLRIGTEERRRLSANEDVALWLIKRLDESGITVVRKGFAGSATNRTLNKEEFKGFALADRFAPFIFVNGTDWPASQVFTIVHECVHLWLGESAIPSGDWFDGADLPVERFCNKVAAQVLMPAIEFDQLWVSSLSVKENLEVLSQHFRVSSLALLYRAINRSLISDVQFKSALQTSNHEFRLATKSKSEASGGSFYNNVGVHLGKRFVREVLTRTLGGKTLYTEAFNLLGTRKTSVIHTMAEKYL
ncbi:MAG: ImmA/IrrE family metallo-endopeptidase [Candidatus Kapabacteria bacterium]|nr:ImmA/IrrE family metallo-endopeptidase [Candidatus Kapabacteria bacterium]